jgi:hypothetical protein
VVELLVKGNHLRLTYKYGYLTWVYLQYTNPIHTANSPIIMSPSPDTPTADSVAQQKTTQPENTLRDAVTFAKDLMKNYGHDPVPGRLITDDVSINQPINWFLG